jgi:acetamidase/formamidase
MRTLLEFARASLMLAAAALAVAETHELKLTPGNVHWGYYDSRLRPVLRIASGDTVRVETMVAGGLERVAMTGVPDSEIPAALKEVESAVTDRGPGAHPLSGPIYVEGAAPGDVLEVRILGFEFLHPFGVT